MRSELDRSRNTMLNREYWRTRWRCKCNHINQSYDKRCFECKRLKPIQLKLNIF